MQANTIASNKKLALELVQVLFRHGARAPVIQELEVYDYAGPSAYEKLDLGTLTNAGKRQQYELGSFLRDRYKNFLTPIYKAEEVYAHSTESERTKISLQLVLAGLYPLNDHTTWNPELKWSPVPYTYTPYNFDVLLRPYDRPQYRKMMESAYQSEEMTKRFASYADFLATVKTETGVECDTAYKVACLFGTLVANEHMKLPLPDWYTPKIKKTYIDFMENVFYDGYTYTKELKKLGPGFIIKKFVENMNLKKTLHNPRKMYLYSAHDDNLAAFIRAHDIQQLRYAPFGSAVILEKLRDPENEVYVRLFARTGDGTVINLKIGQHENICPIDDYLKIVNDFIPSDEQMHAILLHMTSSAADLKNIFFRDTYVKKV